MSGSRSALPFGRVGDSIADLIREADSRDFITYPWTGLEDVLRRSGADSLRLVGYGSLVNAGSASVTIDERRANRATPVAAHGVRRIFNYEMDSDHSRYVPADAPDARALLNAERGEMGVDALNGVLLEVLIEEVQALRERETDYDLAPVVCEPWDRDSGKAGLAWVLICSPDSESGSRRVNNRLTPNPDYYRVCREGAASFGDAFLEAWLDSTFLGDKVTSARAWEKSNTTVLCRESEA